MGGSIVVAYTAVDPAVFAARLDGHGLFFEPFTGLPRHFHVYDVVPADLPFDESDEQVESIEPDDIPLDVAEAVTIDPGITGRNWGLIRHTQRDPWNNTGLRLPITRDLNHVRQGAGVDVYVLDSGIKTTLTAEFGTRATNVYEYYSSGGAGDDLGHGTAVAACAAGAVSGLARQADIWSFKVIDSNNSLTSAAAVAGIGEALQHYQGRAATNRPAVVNMSFGGGSTSLGSAGADAIAAGMVLVAAAGNDSADLLTTTTYPAENDNVICCGAVTMGDTIAAAYWMSNYGSRVDLLAGGKDVWLPAFGGGYRSWDGTSFASPHVAGAIACVLGDYQRLTTAAQVCAVRYYMQQQATWGRYQPSPRAPGMTPAILYLDPGSIYPPVPGLTPLGG